MLRTSLTRSIRPAVPCLRGIVPLHITRGMAEGSTGSGSSRPGGGAQGDAYTRREKANEDFYMREKEKEKLLDLQKKLKDQTGHIKELDKHIQEITKEQGGEHN